MIPSVPVIEAIAAQKILPLFFHEDEGCCRQIVEALYDAGIRVIEFTARGKTALNTFKTLAVSANNEMPDLHLGIGTIKNSEQAKQFVDAGARFVISPGYVPELAAYALKNNILYVPGCMTIHEIIAAENMGIRFVKLFPANMLGIPFLKNIRPLFPEMMFMPTGGIQVSKESLLPWFEAGVVAVGLGSSLISDQFLANCDYTAVQNAASQALDLLKPE